MTCSRFKGATAALLLHASSNISVVSAFAPPTAGHPSIRQFRAATTSNTRLRDAEDLASVLEKADCKTYTPNKSSGASSSSKDDIIVNGTAKRVKQNPLGKAADAISASIFAGLHYNDDLGIKDSSKNLRVLWSRAYLNNAGAMKDDIAYQLLPKNTRDVIKVLPKNGPLVNFQEFITSRTEFIDGAVDSFLRGVDVVQDQDGEKKKPQIVLFGAGYDTRSLRYNGRADFYEVDLPDVVEGKGRLQRYWKDLKAEQGSNEEVILPTRLGYDLNDAADSAKPSLTQALADAGLKSDTPTLFVWEAVLFYVKPEAVLEIFSDTFSFGDQSVYCLVDSLKPAVTTSFLHVAREFFDGYNLNVIDHNSRWGGAVHFALAGRKDSTLTETMLDERDDLPFSYLATSVEKGVEEQASDKASFNNHWYAVAYPWQIKKEVYATRLWGEPIVLYHDVDDNLVCAKDVCPHRSAPLSMSKMNSDGQLECMYHGWAFGKEGECEHVPSQDLVGAKSRPSSTFMKKACLKTYAVQEHEGLVWVWRGNILEADATKLPVTRKDASTYPCDTVLDYNVDWQYLVENNLDSPHLFWLHNGSVPPVRSLNFIREKVNQVKLKYFRDGSGHGHYGQTTGGKPKIIRFDAPNIVRHGGVSSFSEEFHIVPLAPGRTRVLIRQNLPKGPILSTFLSIPFSEPFLQKLVNIWNYHIALEDYSVMQGQAHNVDDLGAPHLAIGDLGDDLVAHFYKWKNAAVKNDGALPFFSKWDGKMLNFKAASTEREMSQDASFSVVDDGKSVDGKDVGTYGILKSYSQQTPTEKYPPVNYNMYKPLLDMDQMMRRDAPGNEFEEGKAGGKAAAVGVAATVFGTATVGAAVAHSMELSGVFSFHL